MIRSGVSHFATIVYDEGSGSDAQVMRTPEQRSTRACAGVPLNVRTGERPALKATNARAPSKSCAERKAWSAMIHRCYNQDCRSFKDYGGRGITVCDEWRGTDGYDSFLAHIGPRPSALHSLDRINNDGRYEPGNVRWATREEQNRNRRSNVWIQDDGRRMLQEDWSRTLGISRHSIRRRLASGYSTEQVLSRDPPNARLIEYDGRALRLCDWARELGISGEVIRWRLRQGWSVKKALSAQKRQQRNPTKGRRRDRALAKLVPGGPQ